MHKTPVRFTVAVKGAVFVLAFGLFGSTLRAADTIVLQIRAGNPQTNTQPVLIKANLPQRITTNDIVSLGGLELGYDVKSSTYYVHKQVDLAPREIQVYRVEIKDIWEIPEATLADMLKHSDALVAKLKGTEYLPSAEGLRKQISDVILGIRTLQGGTAVRSGDEAIQHVRAFEANLRDLDLVRKFVGRLENLVLGSGQDVDKLIGGYSTTEPPRRRDAPRPDDDRYQTALVRITVQNTSPTLPRKIPVKRDLPPEIHPEDVLDPGDLEVVSDIKSGQCYVYKENVEIPPGASVTFEVKIRDKWNINKPRFKVLREAGQDLLKLVAAEGTYKVVAQTLEGLLKELGEVEKTPSPETLDDRYVAFFRQQSERLDLIEQKLNRVETALRPMKPKKYGFVIQPPSMRTTWLIIYVILIFLAVTSLLFFLRWYGRAKSERFDAEQ